MRDVLYWRTAVVAHFALILALAGALGICLAALTVGLLEGQWTASPWVVVGGTIAIPVLWWRTWIPLASMLGCLNRGVASDILRCEAYKADDEWWVAECFEVAAAAQGRSFEEAKSNLEDALGLILETVTKSKEEGMHCLIPGPVPHYFWRRLWWKLRSLIPFRRSRYRQWTMAVYVPIRV